MAGRRETCVVSDCESTTGSIEEEPSSRKKRRSKKNEEISELKTLILDLQKQIFDLKEQHVSSVQNHQASSVLNDRASVVSGAQSLQSADSQNSSLTLPTRKNDSHPSEEHNDENRTAAVVDLESQLEWDSFCPEFLTTDNQSIPFTLDVHELSSRLWNSDISTMISSRIFCLCSLIDK
jgi:hypothetical protein